VRLIHGDIKVSERTEIISQFKINPEINILLSSEVGSEGHDFQFCDTLFNYDLPWNPMKVEQRIGRIDRFGQESPRIRIYNFVIQDSIEERIFQRLYDRIGIFKASIGDLEEILGEEIRELSRSIFSRELTPEEEADLAERVANNIIRHKQEMEEFEEQRLQFMGQDAIFQGELEQAIESGRFVSEKEVHAVVDSFIQKQFPRSRLEDNGDSTYALMPDRDLVQHVIAFIVNTRATDQTAQDFLRHLRENEYMPLTFSAAIAYERKLVEFVTPRHPIARAATEFWNSQVSPALPVASIIIKGDPKFEGDYYFFVYSFDARALERNMTLVSVAIYSKTLEPVPDLSYQFLRLVQAAFPASSEMNLWFDEFHQALFEKARKVATRFAAVERDHREEDIRRLNDSLVNARLAATEQTYQAKLRKVRGYLEVATEQRIRRMREGELRNIEAKYEAKVRELETQRQVSVSYSLVLAGLARILPS